VSCVAVDVWLADFNWWKMGLLPETYRITWLTTDVGTEEVRIRRIFNLMDGNENLKLMKI
jgi:hypothetical protein